MPAIFYLVISGFIFAIGQITAPKPEVVLMRDGAVVDTATANSPIVVMMDGQDVQVRGAKGGLVFAQAPAEPTNGPFYRNGFGEWTVACKADCHEHDHPWDK